MKSLRVPFAVPMILQYKAPMNERLTSSPTASKTDWTLLAFPLMLLLVCVALIPLQSGDDNHLLHIPIGNKSLLVSLESLALMVLCAQSGLIIRTLLPAKSPATLKAFAGVCGIGIPFIFLQGFLPFFNNPLLKYAGAILMIFAWILTIFANTKNALWIVASGLCIGMACSVSPICLAGLLALFIYLLLQKAVSPKKKLFNIFLWIASAICGLIPAINHTLPLPPYENPEIFNTGFIQDGLSLIWQNSPGWAWLFILLGFLVALLQKQKILLALILPFLLFNLLFNGFIPLKFWNVRVATPNELLWQVSPTLLLPLAWFTAFGILRMVRGFEQAGRKLHPQHAKAIPQIATLTFLSGFLIKMADIYSLFG
jgi:hypothetical protein